MRFASFIVVLASCFAMPAYAQGGVSAKQTEVMDKLLANYAAKAKEEAKEEKVAPKPFSAEEGRKFYLVRRSWQSHDRTCSGCHTQDPTQDGKHIESKKPIKPLAPAANSERFVDVQKVEKNFAEHCMDLYERDCRAQEKGHFISYLKSVK